jgi:hypothetical protein
MRKSGVEPRRSWPLDLRKMLKTISLKCFVFNMLCRCSFCGSYGVLLLYKWLRRLFPWRGKIFFLKLGRGAAV